MLFITNIGHSDEAITTIVNGYIANCNYSKTQDLRLNFTHSK